MKIIITSALFTAYFYPVWTVAESLPVPAPVIEAHAYYHNMSDTNRQKLAQETGDQILLEADRPASNQLSAQEVEQLSDALKKAIGAQHPEQKAAIERGEHVEGTITLEGGEEHITCGDFPGHFTVNVRDKDGSTHSVECSNSR